jgi:hypothetical protein
VQTFDVEKRRVVVMLHFADESKCKCSLSSSRRRLQQGVLFSAVGLIGAFVFFNSLQA